MRNKSYKSFLSNKSISFKSCGFDVDQKDLNSALFDWQRACVQWAVKKGRSALFEGTGLGKTLQQLEWARIICKKTKGDVLILAPLAVAAQTKREGEKFGIDVNICRDQSDVQKGINITNYQRLHLFDPSVFIGIVADESGILKNFSGKIRTELIDMFATTPYKLCCTATPSPNDYTELGNTAEFLGVMTYNEMLSMFFINDSGDTTANWRLKGHVVNNVFWQWLSSWGMMIHRPEDIGFNGDNFILPELRIHHHVISGKTSNRGYFFVQQAKTLSERREARRRSLKKRVEITANLVNSSDDIWLIWCDLNIESDSLKRTVNNCIEVKGSDSNEHKERSAINFSSGDIKRLVSKPSIFGHGLNWQVCNNMAFCGLSDSFERYYQAIRRCWRFGQDKPVDVHLVYSEEEKATIDNIRRKEDEMIAMNKNMIGHMQTLMQSELKSTSRQSTPYQPKIKMQLPKFLTEMI